MLRSQVLIANIIRIAEAHPERVFAKLRFRENPSVNVTYQDLLTHGAKYAAFYQAHKIQKNDVIVIILDHSVELLYAFVGALLHGAIPSIFAHPSIKISAREYRHTLLRMLETCGTRFLLTKRELLEPLSSAELVHAGVQLLEACEYANYLAAADRPRFDPDQIVLLQHSSGTTGLKKGVALSNRSVINQLRNYAQTLRLCDDDKIVSWLPLYHDMGLVASFILPMATGIPLVLMSPFDWIANPIMLLQAIHEDRCTLCWMPNFAYNFLSTRLAVEATHGLDLSSMRAFINCAEPIRAASHQLFYQRFAQNGVRQQSLCTCYAMAENTFAVTQGGILKPVRVESIDADTLRDRRTPSIATTDAGQIVVSSGEPIPHTQIRIVDDNGGEMSERRVGEIIIKSNSLLSEYYHCPDLTRQAIKNRWYYTGDLGYLSEGSLFVIGRQKDMIIIAGKNLYPEDIEDIVSSIDGVHAGRVVAFGLYDDKIGTEELIILAESTTEERSLQLPIKLAIAKAIREQLECIANEVVLVPPMWLLKSSSGKIARSRNCEKYLQHLRAQ